MTIDAREHSVKTYSIERRPTISDTTMNAITLFGRANNVEIPLLTRFFLAGSENVMFIYEGTDSNGNAIYREILDSRHIEDLQATITALQTKVNEISYEVISVASLPTSYANATGNDTTFKFPFQDANNSWSDGAITLAPGNYEFKIRQIFDSVPVATNHTHLYATFDPVDATKATYSMDFWNDADRLVTTSGDTNVKSISSFFILSEESNVSFYIQINGAGSDNITVSGDLTMLLKKV